MIQLGKALSIHLRVHQHNATAVPYQRARIDTQTPEIQSNNHLGV